MAELIPELAHCLGVLAAEAAPGGHRLVRPDGSELATSPGLAAQGVGHGSLLVLVAAADPPQQGRCDDVVEEVARETRDASPLGGRRLTGLVAVLAGGVLLVADLVGRLTPLHRAQAVPAALVLAVLAGGAAPHLALAATGLSRILPRLTTTDGDLGRGVPDPARVAAQTRAARLLVEASTAATWVIVVAGAPVPVATGPAGALLVLAAGVVVSVRSVGRPVQWSARRCYLADLAQWAALAALPPLLVLTTGLPDALRGRPW